jgi:hypothetical protein
MVISGSGKKVGKTWLVTALIRKFSRELPLIALKISPHVHDSLGSSIKIFDSDEFRIFKEMEPHHKNSGQYLSAGAKNSYFMEAEDRFLEEAFHLFMKTCNPQSLPLICESGALGGKIKPGVMIFIAADDEPLSEPKRHSAQLADLILPARIFSADEITGRIAWQDGSWKLKPWC